MRRKMMKKARGIAGDMAEVDSDNSLDEDNPIRQKVDFALNYKQNTTSFPVIKELYNKTHHPNTRLQTGKVSGQDKLLAMLKED